MVLRIPADPEQLLDAVPEAIVGVAPDGRIAVVNAEAERLFGYQRQILLGQPVEILVPDLARPDYRSRYLASPQLSSTGASLALPALRRDGTEFPAEISLAALETEDGVLVTAAIRDASDRMMAEAKFRALLEFSLDAIIGVASDGRITVVNAQAERLFGFQRQSLLGQPVEILVPDLARTTHPDRRRRYLADPRPRPMGAGLALSARRHDGTEFPAEISLTPLVTEDGVLVAAAVRDVTDRLRAQALTERLEGQVERERRTAQLHRAQRLESLGHLAGGVAHDFNNLLGVIINYSTFVEEELAAAAGRPDGVDRTALGRDVEQIRHAAERATDLTRQLLAFGRRHIVRPQVVNLNDIVADVEPLLRRSLGDRITLTTTLADGLWPILADAHQLEQVLVNLTVNARDAMPDGGQLTIDTANLDIDQRHATEHHDLAAGRCVRLRVRDTGHGMLQDVLDRAFEPFFTTKPKGQGSGLGLSAVHGIIAQAGGHAHIDSAPGAGTTFSAVLPITDRAQTPTQTGGHRTNARGDVTVLVVEDEEPLREVTRRILARNGYHVITAASGAEALELAAAQDQEIHLLITDVIMPHMLGNEVAERIRAIRPAIRVLFMSGYAHSVITSRGTLDAGVALLEKPFTETELLVKINDVLGAAEPA